MNLSVTLAWICMSSQGTKSNPPIFMKSENPIKKNNKKKRMDEKKSNEWEIKKEKKEVLEWMDWCSDAVGKMGYFH